MYKLAGWLLRFTLVVLLLGSVLAQVLVPLYASQVAAVNPEVAYLVVPYSAAAILFIGCVQVALLALWRLVALVDRGVILTRIAVRWVDVITACAVIATALSAGVLVHMLAFVPGGGGPMIYYMAACITAGLASVFLMLVVRGVITSAAADQASPLDSAGSAQEP
jgi:hypothetical protein